MCRDLVFRKGNAAQAARFDALMALLQVLIQSARAHTGLAEGAIDEALRAAVLRVLVHGVDVDGIMTG